MSQFLKSPDSLFSDRFHAFLAEYVCPEFVKFIGKPTPGILIEHGGEEWIQKMLDNSNQKLRTYGSARELAENLKIFRNHPESWRILPDRNDLFQESAGIYYSLSNNPYILKSDLCVILQNMACQNISGSLPLISILKNRIGLTLKNYARASPNRRVEFVKFDHERFGEIEKELREGFKKARELDNESLMDDMRRKDYHSIAAKLNAVNPVMPDEKDDGCLIRDVLPLVVKDGVLQALNIFIASICSNYIKHVISQHPEVFNPTSSLAAVRVFEDGDQRFVLSQEIREVFHKSVIEKRAEDGPFCHTCFLEDVEKNNCDKNEHNVEFIRTPILRAKHRAVPIPMGFERFGILAVDMLFEFLRNLIFGEKAFQKQTPDFLQAFEESDVPFNSENSIYFLHTNVADILNKAAKAALRNVENVPAKDVRNAKKDGFTVQNLKNELAHLGLLNAFPEIQNHADVVYSEVDKRKKKNVLRTCDLFDAIEHCQLICILERLPKIRKFLHNQKGCHRVYGYKCEHCEEEKKKELQKPPESTEIKDNEQKTSGLQSSSRIENLEKELAQIKLHLEKTLLQNQKLQTENQKLSIENDKKALTSSKSSNTQFLDKKLSTRDTVLACTSNRIQCLICEIHVDSSNKDDVIRCPSCKRRFHKKCAFEWLQEHSQCPACNGDLPKI